MERNCKWYLNKIEYQCVSWFEYEQNPYEQSKYTSSLVVGKV
jgi:hypothetical protein